MTQLFNSEVNFDYFEIGANQKEMVKKLFNSYGFNNIQFFLDLEKKERVVCVKKDA